MVTEMQTNEEFVLGFEFTGEFDIKIVEEFVNLVRPKLNASEKTLNLFCKIDQADFSHITLKSFLDNQWIDIIKTFNPENGKKIHRVAVVGNSDFEKKLVEADAFFAKLWNKNIDERYFKINDIDKAWDFVLEA